MIIHVRHPDNRITTLCGRRVEKIKAVVDEEDMQKVISNFHDTGREFCTNCIRVRKARQQ